MIEKDAIEILKSIQDGLEETRFLERCAIDMALEALNTHDDLCENLAWYINERQRLLKVIEYSKPNEGLQRTIRKALERPHGEWIKEYLQIDEHHFRSYAKCKVCGCSFKPYSFAVKEFDFCPKCGSPMTEIALEILRKRAGGK